MTSSGGWYNTRKQYRSVAFGTWKVGDASQMRNKECSEEDIRRSVDRSSSHLHTTSITLKKGKDKRMGDSSPNLNKIHPIHQTNTQLSLGLLPSQSVCPDMFSSTEYVEYVGRKAREDSDSWNGNTVSEPLQAAFRVDGNTSLNRRNRIETSLQRAHHRSHSAGADASFSILPSPSTSDMKSVFGRDAVTSNVKFLRATKKFFKRIYSTATLPNKKHTVSTDDFNQIPLKDNRYINDRLMDDDDNSSNIEDISSPISYQFNSNYPSSFHDNYPDSGLDMDRSSTPDESLESMTITSKSDSSSETQSRRETQTHNSNWNDLFEQLRREMMLMRERDAQILADLHHVESQIQNVKMSQMRFLQDDRS